MAKIDSAKRYFLIINKIRKDKRVTFLDIADYLQKESELQGLNFNISKRTFQRDISDIGSIYSIYIKFNFSGKYYFIEEDFEPEVNDRMFEAFNVYNALRMNEQLSDYILLEQRKSEGTEHIYGLLHAIKSQHQVQFTYNKYFDNSTSTRTVNPLAIKEFKHRWFLLAEESLGKKIKIFALDRMRDLIILPNNFETTTLVDFKAMFKQCFGIILPQENETPQQIILSFNPFQGKYIKSLPLHSSQQTLIDNDMELRVSLTIYLTYDFKMEILSLGENAKVIEPQQFASEIKSTLQNSLNNY